MQTEIYNGLLRALSANEKPLALGGFPAVQRDCPDRIPGRLDPRTAAACAVTREAATSSPEAIDPELLRNLDKLCGPENPEAYGEVELMRYQFGWRSLDSVPDVLTKKEILTAPEGEFTVWHYEAPGTGKARPCIVFIHGGGFVAGDTQTVENQCRLLAKKAGAVVLSVDYPFAPEHRYPAGFNACYATVRWAYENAERLGISKNRIGVAGDSAGGNLSLACALRDRAEGGGAVSYMCLIYPLLSRAENAQEPYYYWKPELFENPEGDSEIEHQIRLIGDMTDANNRWVVPDREDRFGIYNSPITADAAGLPKTLLITAEYDFLRAECDAYAEKLAAAGVPGRAIRYGGIFHGTFDRLGYAPQVEDMILEMAKDLRAL